MLNTPPKTILMTGSAGFIGFHTSKALLEKGDTIIGFDNLNSINYESSLKEKRNEILEKYPNYRLIRSDIADLNAVKRAFQENKIDKVCHLAALAGVRHSMNHPHEYIQANIIGFQNVIDEAKNAKVENFVYASSSSVYGKNKKFPTSEEDSTNYPISLYAATKKSNELVAHTYNYLFGLKCSGFRFFNVYGPWGRPDTALFIFVKNISEDKPIDVNGYGKMKRDFTYIDDIVAGLTAALDKNLDYEVFNLGSARKEGLMDFIKEIEKAMGKKAKINFLPMPPGDVAESHADITKAKDFLNYEPKTMISAGVKNFVDWYLCQSY